MFRYIALLRWRRNDLSRSCYLLDRILNLVIWLQLFRNSRMRVLAYIKVMEYVTARLSYSWLDGTYSIGYRECDHAMCCPFYVLQSG